MRVVDTDMNDGIFFVGNPRIEDNEQRVADLEPTIETKNRRLKLKAVLDGDQVVVTARAALAVTARAALFMPCPG